MKSNPILVELFTIPQAVCDSDKANWTQAGEMVRKQLENKFGNTIAFRHVEFMSNHWFEHQQAQKILEGEVANFPFVLVDGEIACADKKINISKIIRMIQSISKQ